MLKDKLSRIPKIILKDVLKGKITLESPLK